MRVFILYCLLGTFCLAPLFTHAQKIKKITEEFEWSTTELTNDSHIDYQRNEKYALSSRYKHVFDKFNLPVTDKERIVPVNISKQRWGLVRVNDDGKVIWQFEGNQNELLGIGLMGNDVVAFSTVDALKPKKITAVVINGNNGQQRSEKVVYETDSPVKTQVLVQNKGNGVFNELMVVVLGKKESSIQLLYFDQNLSSSKTVSLKTTFSFELFAGSLVNTAGEIFVAGLSDDQLVMARFNNDGKELNKMTTSLPRRSDSFVSIIEPDKTNANAVVIGLNYKNDQKDHVNQIIEFDMVASKISKPEPEVMDKDYARKLNLEKVKGVMDGNLKWMDDVELVGMMQCDNKWVLIKEIRTSLTEGSSTVRFTNHAWFASIYDGGLKLEKTVGIYKRYESFLQSSLSIGIGWFDDRLIVVTPVLAGIGTITVLVASINVQTGEIEKTSTIDQLKSVDAPIEAGATLWFKTCFLLQRLRNEKGFLKRWSKCSLYKMEM